MSTLKGMYDIFRVLFLCGFKKLNRELILRQFPGKDEER